MFCSCFVSVSNLKFWDFNKDAFIVDLKYLLYSEQIYLVCNDMRLNVTNYNQRKSDIRAILFKHMQL